jgi:hypothetical protein
MNGFNPAAGAATRDPLPAAYSRRSQFKAFGTEGAAVPI